MIYFNRLCLQRLVDSLFPLHQFQKIIIKEAQIPNTFLSFIFIYNIIKKPSTMKTQSEGPFVNLKIYDCIRFNPSTIRSIFTEPQQNRLYVSRENYSEIYQIATNEKIPVLQQIAQMESSIKILQIDGVLGLFKPFYLKVFRNSKWEYHSFTTQLLAVRVNGQTVYTFHENETMEWHFSDEDFHYKYLSESSSPYHLDSQGTIVGLGKKVRIVNKKAKLTVCEVIEKKWIFAGDDQGSLHIYDWKFASHVKTFTDHQGPILAINVDSKAESVYYTGSDSKINMCRLVGQEWKQGLSCRGQSHDILSINKVGDYIVSGGVTTDLCFYQLQNGQFNGEFHHKISYSSHNRTQSDSKIVVVNHRSYFQIWQLGNTLNKSQLVVKYEMPADKFIVDCRIYSEPIQENTHLLLIVTDEDTLGWKFSYEGGLTKYITIKNQYVLTHLLAKHSFIGIRIDGLIERVNCNNGKIEEITYCQVDLPTDIKSLGGGLIMIGSKISNVINIINMKQREVVKSIRMSNTYTYLEYLQGDQFIIQYFNNPELRSLNIQTQEEKVIIVLPVSIIRFGGWLNSVSKGENQLKTKLKKYWYGVSEGKIIVIPNLHKEGKKKLRIKQTDRIAQVFRPTSKKLGCNLGIIPYNFQRMVEQMELKPVFTKKII